MTLKQALWEHLITKRKYNKLLIINENLKEDIKDLNYIIKELKRQLRLKDNVWDTRVIELEKKLSKRGGKNVRKSKSTGVKVSRAKPDDNK